MPRLKLSPDLYIVWVSALIMLLVSCTAPPASVPSKPVVTTLPGTTDKVITTAATPVVVVETPAVAPVVSPDPLPAVQTKSDKRICAHFTPVYLTPAEVHALSAQTLTKILNNNDAGAARCGWTKHSTGE